MKEQFKVIAIDNKMMTLEVDRSSGCNSCESTSSCGTGILSNYYSVFNRPYRDNILAGDFVTLEISSSKLFLRAFQLYILPLLSLFIGGVLGSILYTINEIGQIVFALIGFFASFVFIKYFIK
ncbi:SoxR reducing system RseC family protein [Candidatus Vesicomyidisocius sp. SY067_SCS001]|uniref:SoxR reducing system RseC family protein n=1 Tax=Candidatus Vesicomyidisocius sp. SY067_SCS001 TaxID=2732590 RepID=UPI00168818A2|nr:SoxR reducing system RseC family protein [Candidatus Vesicomyosocius sp. SY067_SCS001]